VDGVGQLRAKGPDVSTYRCWFEDDEEASATNVSSELAADAAEDFATAALNGDPSKSAVVHVRRLGGNIRTFAVTVTMVPEVTAKELDR
jgi:hypothetical protein